MTEEQPQALAPGWATVRTGLILVARGAASMVGASVLGVILLIVLPSPWGAISYAAMGIGCLGVFVVGKALCCAVPVETGLRRLALTSFTCTILTLIFATQVALLAFQSSRRSLLGEFDSNLVALVSLVLLHAVFITGHVASELFLVGIARSFQNDVLARSVQQHLVVFAVWAAAVLTLQASPFLLWFGRDLADLGLFIVWCLGYFIFLHACITFGWYLILVSETVQTLTLGLAKGQDAGTMKTLE